MDDESDKNVCRNLLQKPICNKKNPIARTQPIVSQGADECNDMGAFVAAMDSIPIARSIFSSSEDQVITAWFFSFLGEFMQIYAENRVKNADSFWKL